jgi:hypothetical protein
MNETTKIALVDTIPPDIMELFGPPPLLDAEEAKVYYGMLTSFARSIRPADLITWMLIKDLADHRVEIARYRRMKVAFVRAAHETKVGSDMEDRIVTTISLVEKLVEMKEERLPISAERTEEYKELHDRLIDHFDECIYELRLMPKLAKGVTMTEADVAALFSNWVKDLERIDTLLQAAEKRFSRTLAEIDHHQRGLGRYCREELNNIIDGEIVEAPTAGAVPADQVGGLKIVSKEALGEATRSHAPRRGSNLSRRSPRRNANEPVRRRLAR